MYSLFLLFFLAHLKKGGWSQPPVLSCLLQLSHGVETVMTIFVQDPAQCDLKQIGFILSFKGENTSK